MACAISCWPVTISFTHMQSQVRSMSNWTSWRQWPNCYTFVSSFPFLLGIVVELCLCGQLTWTRRLVFPPVASMHVWFPPHYHHYSHFNHCTMEKGWLQIPTYQTKWHHIPEDCDIHLCENLKSYIVHKCPCLWKSWVVQTDKSNARITVNWTIICVAE
jgi:hypothetical protein